MHGLWTSWWASWRTLPAGTLLWSPQTVEQSWWRPSCNPAENSHWGTRLPLGWRQTKLWMLFGPPWYTTHQPSTMRWGTMVRLGCSHCPKSIFRFLSLFTRLSITFFCFVFAWVVNQDCKSCLSEEFVQAYAFADSIRTWMVSFTDMTHHFVDYLPLSLYIIMMLNYYADVIFLSVGDETEIPGQQNECSWR